MSICRFLEDAQSENEGNDRQNGRREDEERFAASTPSIAEMERIPAGSFGGFSCRRVPDEFWSIVSFANLEGFGDAEKG